MRKTFSIAFLLLVQWASLNAQNLEIDSLKRVLKNTKNDSVLCSVSGALVEHLARKDPDTSIVLAENMLRVAEKNAKEMPETGSLQTYFLKQQATALNDLGYFAGYKGKLDESIAYYESSLAIRQKINDRSGIAQCFNNIGSVYVSKGKNADAIRNFKKGIEIRTAIGDSIGLCSCYNNLGVIYYNSGNYPKAFEYYNKNLAIEERLKNKPGVATSLNNIGHLYYTQGNLEKSMEYFRRALKMRRELNDKQGIANIYNNIGSVHAMKHQSDSALKYSLLSLSLREEVGDKSGIGNSLNNIGNNYENLENYQLALEYYRKALEINKTVGDKSRLVSAYNNISGIYRKMKLYDKAFETILPALKISRETGHLRNTRHTLSLLALLNQCVGKMEEAEKCFLEILELTSKGIEINFPVFSEKEKELYFNTLSPDYAHFNSFCLKRQDQNPAITEFAYNIALKNKGLLLKSAATMRAAILENADSAVSRKYQQWLDLKRKIAQLYNKGKNIRDLEEKANKLEKELIMASRDFDEANTIQNLSWNDVKKSLKKGEAAIEFVNFHHEKMIDSSGANVYCALLITSESEHPQMIQLFEEKELDKILKDFSGDNHDLIRKIYGHKQEPETRLYNLIWGPVQDKLPGIHTVYFSPSGLLHKISFSALSENKNTFLIDNLKLNLVSSTGKVVLSENFVLQDSNQASLFGGIDYTGDSSKIQIWKYLEGTKKETEQISAALKSKNLKVNYFSGRKATESEFKSLSPVSQVIHIATHGFFYPDPMASASAVSGSKKKLVFRGNSADAGEWSFSKNKDPLMRSGLVFAGANNVWQRHSLDEGEDGILTAAEVATLDLRKTGLVVLSACETGLGDIKGSEGVYGLQRAFKMTGVKFIMMSLWQVPDKETSEFMITFYNQLLRIKDIKKAFGQTQREMRKKYDPYFWAAFVLVE